MLFDKAFRAHHPNSISATSRFGNWQRNGYASNRKLASGARVAMEAEEIKSAGNTFAGTFLISFIFVYFAIIEPHFAPKGLLEQHADETLQEIEDGKKQLKSQLARIRLRHSHIGSRLDTSLPFGSPMTLSKSHAIETAQLEKDEEAAQQIHEKMVQLDLAQQATEKTKLEKKQYSIPLVSISLDEETLLKFFPVLVLGGLVRLLFYRWSLLKSISCDADGFLPPWVAPLPLGRTRISFRSWVFVNLLGLSLSGIVVLMTLRFIFSYARENFSRLGLVAIDALLVLLWAGSYLFLIASAIFGKAVQTQVNTLEPE